MSTNAKACADEVNNHEFLRKSILSKVARLKNNFQTGCQVCGLLYRALETFYGRQLLEEHADTIEFNPCGRFFATYNVVLKLEPNRINALVDSEFGFTVGAEIVYEMPKLSLEIDLNKPLDPMKLDGVYSPLGILPARKIPALPDESIDLMQHWIQQCIKSHPQCRSEAHSLLPKRVIDVGGSQGGFVRLHESNGQRAHYIALSHQWGKSQLLTTKTCTLDARKESIEWSSLSQTFRDSILLTRLLGVRYLWIDSLCIIQDDPLDWELESAKMAEIYEKSYVTISANTTTGTLLGQAASRATRSLQIDVVNFKGTTSPVVIRPIIPHDMFFTGSLESYGQPGKDLDPGYPLFKRAWCFQERLLATRILHFADAEVTFECKTLCDCECGSGLHQRITPLKSHFASLALKPPGILPGDLGNNAWEGWTQIVNQYVRKDITYPTDILPALAGIASRVKCEELGRYIAGLWESPLPQGLFWFAQFSSCKQVSIATAPTFSWASLAGTSRVNEVTWWYIEEGNTEQLFRILDVQCHVSGQNSFGMVAKASIRLHGFLLPVWLKGEKGPPPYNSIIRLGDVLKRHVRAFMDRAVIADMRVEMDLNCFFGFTRAKENYKKRKETETKTTVCVLLLQCVGRGVYQRVGCVPDLENEEPWLSNAKEMEFTLI